MEVLDPLDHLITDHQGTFQRHNLVTLYEDVLDTGAQQIHEHYIVVTLCCDCVNFRNSNNMSPRVEILVHSGFVVELRELGRYFFQFGRILLRRICPVFG